MSSVYVILDSDHFKIAKIDNINQIKTLEKLLEICKKKLHMPEMEERDFGFKSMIG